MELFVYSSDVISLP